MTTGTGTSGNVDYTLHPIYRLMERHVDVITELWKLLGVHPETAPQARLLQAGFEGQLRALGEDTHDRSSIARTIQIVEDYIASPIELMTISLYNELPDHHKDDWAKELFQRFGGSGQELRTLVLRDPDLRDVRQAQTQPSAGAATASTPAPAQAAPANVKQYLDDFDQAYTALVNVKAPKGAGEKELKDYAKKLAEHQQQVDAVTEAIRSDPDLPDEDRRSLLQQIRTFMRNNPLRKP